MDNKFTFSVKKSKTFDSDRQGFETNKVTNKVGNNKFEKILEKQIGHLRSYEVKEGDNLIKITKNHLKGYQISHREIYNAALELAKHNKIDNPNLIYPKQQINLASIQILKSRKNIDSSEAKDNLILDKTLTRAVKKGYIAENDFMKIKDKIIKLSKDFGFNANDFAMVSLIESDGFNPKATNGICHGIIQFCEGKNSGMTSIDMQGKPKQLMKMSTLDQLDLVEMYFKDTKLKKFSPVSLDDLYLTILTPVARNEKNSDSKLNIKGKQANILYENNNRNTYITRNSITSGIIKNAENKLNIRL